MRKNITCTWWTSSFDTCFGILVSWRTCKILDEELEKHCWAEGEHLASPARPLFCISRGKLAVIMGSSIIRSDGPAEAELIHLARDAATVCIFVRAKKGEGRRIRRNKSDPSSAAQRHTSSLKILEIALLVKQRRDARHVHRRRARSCNISI